MSSEIGTLSLPIGWSRSIGDSRSMYLSLTGWIFKLLGLLLTTLVVSVGAPFLNALLKEFIRRAKFRPVEKNSE